MKKLFFIFSIFALSSMSALSAYAASWQKDNVGWWYRYDNGSYPRSRWFTDDKGDWYYADGSGYILTNQWFQDGGKWYYLTGSGKMAANQWVENYYLGETGYMLTNTSTPDGYWVSEDGAWIAPADSYIDIDEGEFALNVEDIEHFDITDTMLYITGTFYTYDETTYTDRYVGYRSENYAVNAGTSYYEKERALSFGKTTRQELLNAYKSGYANVIIIKVYKGIVKDLRIQTRRH